MEIAPVYNRASCAAIGPGSQNYANVSYLATIKFAGNITELLQCVRCS